MMSRTAAKRPSDPGISYPVKRRKLKHASADTIRKYLASDEKGQTIQALYMVFESDSFSFETHQRTGLACRFITFLNLEGYTFIGYGDTKVLSRSCASKTALLHLLDYLEPTATNFGWTADDYYPTTIDVPLLTEAVSTDDNLPNIIAASVLNKYDELRRRQPVVCVYSQLPWYKMIAGIVMVRDSDHKTAKVLVLATGTKCIEPKQAKHDGSVLFDSHAEILSRRAFQHFLYSQIKRCRSGSENSILRQHGDGDHYEIDKGVSLYLFVSSAPCGDCRVFAASDKDSRIDKHPNRICRGVLRIKLDGGNSAVPIARYEAEDRFMIMSCSDKLLKMNILGVQGALLSNLLEPVYMAGIIIGDLFQQSHASRALCERISCDSNADNYPQPFRLHRVVVRCVEKPVPFVSHAPKLSVNWIYGEDDDGSGGSVEITNAAHGKMPNGCASRLCKRSLFEKFLKIYAAAGDTENGDERSYDNFKNAVTKYQRAKQIFYDQLEARKLGKWVRRNHIYNQFYAKPAYQA